MSRHRASRRRQPSAVPGHYWTCWTNAQTPTFISPAYLAHIRVLMRRTWRGDWRPVACVSLEPSSLGGQPWWYAVTFHERTAQTQRTKRCATRREGMRWVEQITNAPVQERLARDRKDRTLRRQALRGFFKLLPGEQTTLAVLCGMAVIPLLASYTLLGAS